MNKTNWIGTQEFAELKGVKRQYIAQIKDRLIYRIVFDKKLNRNVYQFKANQEIKVSVRSKAALLDDKAVMNIPRVKELYKEFTDEFGTEQKFTPEYKKALSVLRNRIKKIAYNNK
jgi:hypothetical protein